MSVTQAAISDVRNPDEAPFPSECFEEEKAFGSSVPMYHGIYKIAKATRWKMDLSHTSLNAICTDTVCLLVLTILA